MKLATTLVALGLAGWSTSTTQAVSTLFYGGDPQFPGGHANQNNTNSAWRFTYKVYDDFTVTGQPWLVTSLFCNLGGDVPSSATLANASYEIRTGMGNNNLGTLVSGGTFPASLTYQSTGSNGYNLFRLQLDLPTSVVLSPGTYWLSLVPNTSYTSGQLYLRDSNLGQGVGMPLNDNASFTFSQFYFFPTPPRPARRPPLAIIPLGSSDSLRSPGCLGAPASSSSGSRVAGGRTDRTLAGHSFRAPPAFAGMSSAGFWSFPPSSFVFGPTL